MRTSILNTATTEQMGYSIFPFFVYTKSKVGENGNSPEGYDFLSLILLCYTKLFVFEAKFRSAKSHNAILIKLLFLLEFPYNSVGNSIIASA